MPKTTEQFADMQFPQHGIDLSRAYGMQAPLTTPVGTNVRTFEGLTQRGRGGSRPGLSKYIPAQLPNGSHEIQHLNVIVDPTTDALLDAPDSPDLDAVNDPSDNPPFTFFNGKGRNPGRLIRNGGWGRQPNRNKKKKIKFVQSLASASDFNASVTTGNLLLVATEVFNSNGAIPTTTGDTQGNIYTPIQTIALLVNGSYLHFALFYAFASATGTLTIQHSTNGWVNGLLAEFSGVSQVQTVDNSSQGTGPPPPLSGLTTLDAGAVSVGGSGEMYFAAFTATNHRPTPSADLTATDISGVLSGGYLLNASMPSIDKTATVTFTNLANDTWAAIAATFKPG